MHLKEFQSLVWKRQGFIYARSVPFTVAKIEEAYRVRDMAKGFYYKNNYSHIQKGLEITKGEFEIFGTMHTLVGVCVKENYCTSEMDKNDFTYYNGILKTPSCSDLDLSKGGVLWRLNIANNLHSSRIDAD